MVRLIIKDPQRTANFWSEKTFLWMNTWWRDTQEDHRPRDHKALEAIKPSHVISYTPQTIKKFANEMGYSRAYLTRKLTEQWLRSPGVVLREVRLKEAAMLLRTTRMKVGDVAKKIGYANSASFGRAFREQYDQTPMAYRRSHG